MPKSYSKFTLENLEVLGLNITLCSLFKGIKIIPSNPSDLLQIQLERGLRRNSDTEKAKSENITAPILFSVEDANEDTVAIYSGHTFNVDKSIGLKGECDFLCSKNPTSYIIDMPFFVVVQALRGNIDDATKICIAQMYAAQKYNHKRHKNSPIIYGATTSGTMWKFLKLTENKVEIDYFQYSLSELPKLLGVLNYIVNQ